MNQNRRAFIGSSGLLGLGGLVSLGNIFAGCGENLSDIPQGFVLNDDEGEVFYIGNTRKAKVSIKISKKTHPGIRTSFLTEIISPGDYIPEHQHKNEDEFILIQRGEATVLIGEMEKQLGPGDLAFIPKGTWHGLKNLGNEYVHMFFGYSPAGFEDYFRNIGMKTIKDNLNFSVDDWERTSRKFGVVYR